MAMDGTVMGKQVVKALLGNRYKSIPKKDRETMEKSWITICSTMIDHMREFGVASVAKEEKIYDENENYIETISTYEEYPLK